MGIIKIVIQRGTAIREVEKTPSKWSGDLFLDYQKKKMLSLPSEVKIVTKHGVSVLKASEYPQVPRLPSGGCVISTARGTATRIL